MRIQVQRYGGYGILIPGKKTTMAHRDTYNVVVDSKERIDKRMKVWEQRYQHDWCLGGGASPEISRSTLTMIGMQQGLSKRDANAAAKKASDALRDSGSHYTNIGWFGPGQGIHTPFTVPGNVKSIRRCGS